jgi:predicted nucleic acid-binding OB-fold protein
LKKKKEGYCGDRHLDGLPGFVLVEIMFYPGNEIKEMKDYIKRSLPICHLVPLNPKEEIKFEKSIVLQNNSKVMEFYNLALELEKYLNEPKLLEELDFEKSKEILESAESINYDMFKNLDEDLEEKIKFAVEIKGKIIPVLQHRIRFLVFSSKK